MTAAAAAARPACTANADANPANSATSPPTADGTWRVSDRIALTIVGGRTQGFRTFAYKSNFTPGAWRVTVETEDGRAVAMLSFDVVEDSGTGERELRAVEG